MTTRDFKQIEDNVRAGNLIPAKDVQMLIDEIRRLRRTPRLDLSGERLNWVMGESVVELPGEVL